MTHDEIVAMAMENYRDGLRMGHGDAIAYLRGALGDDHPVLRQMIELFDKEDRNDD